MNDKSQMLAAATSRASEREFMLDRPFHIGVVLWGERFRDDFLDYCLPSLMAPGNVPAISTRQRSKFLIATLPEDWAAMTAASIFQRMARYIEPVFIEIPPCPPGRSGREHMGIGHALVCEQAYREKAYSVHVMPDSMFSDGTLSRAQELVREGVELILTPALRFGAEPFFANLAKVGLVSSAGRHGNSEPLIISGRQMAEAAINGFHPETLAYDWNSDRFVLNHAAVWWRVSGEDGIVLHSFSWAPVVLDYAAVRNLDTSMMHCWTIDGDFLHRNIGHSTAVHVVTDSDEMFFGSWTPMADQIEPPVRTRLLRLQWVRNLIRESQIRRVYDGPSADPLKRRMFVQPVRWHGRSLNREWAPVEREAERRLANVLGDTSTGATKGRRLALRATTALLGMLEPILCIAIYPVYRVAVRRRVRQIMRGDRDALRRVGWHARRVGYQIIGRPFNEPPPKPPTTVF